VEYNDATNELAQRLRVDDPEPDGWRYVTLDGIRLGRLKKDSATGHWHCEWRAGWHDKPVQFDGTEPLEKAEIWAVHEIAGMFDKEERAYRRQREQPG
jgi:hypothetical protein